MSISNLPGRADAIYDKGVRKYLDRNGVTMFSMFAKKEPKTAYINGQPVTVNPKETLLQAALREGINFPYSCRVGGCATCKCKLEEGKVKELTETGYILSDEDLDQGYILACQSVPKTDIKIEVDLSAQAHVRTVAGRVIGQEKLTHDITRLALQLDEALLYKPGQYANISVESVGEMSRSYSFATPASPDGQVSFFVRQVPGGCFSTAINERELIEQPISLEGPMGDFWLRPGTEPMLLIAGGSGLAPIIALLQGAIADGVSRPATLLFGAREQRDLYALEEIQAIQLNWQGEFHFEPVLSEEAEGSSWQGARGFVTEKIEQQLKDGAHAYLCGPPVMIDAATDILRGLGVEGKDIHADRFTTQQDVVSAAS